MALFQRAHIMEHSNETYDVPHVSIPKNSYPAITKATRDSFIKTQLKMYANRHLVGICTTNPTMYQRRWIMRIPSRSLRRTRSFHAILLHIVGCNRWNPCDNRRTSSSQAKANSNSGSGGF